MSLEVVPITIAEACEFIGQFHRHNKPPVSGRFAIGASDGDRLVGVAIVGRTTARMLHNPWTAEVTRVCVLPDAPRNACSFLYGRCWRCWQMMGGKRMVTYNTEGETGASLRGAGFKMLGETKAQPWSREGRKREWQPIYGQKKFRWEIEA